MQRCSKGLWEEKEQGKCLPLLLPAWIQGPGAQGTAARATASISLCQVNSSPFPSRAPPLSPGAVLLGRECFRVGGCTRSSPCEQELSLALACAQFLHRLGIQ